MKPQNLPEDIDGNQDDNPYQTGGSLYPYNPNAKLTQLFSMFWSQREYWRHWKRVKRDTGRWPLWSAVFHLIVMVGGVTNIALFLWAREAQDWSASRSWILGIAFALLWLVFFEIGRDVVRDYEARLYSKHENTGAHIEKGYQQARRGELTNGEQARIEIQHMKENWRRKRVLKR